MPESRVTVGNVEIISLLDIEMEFDWGAFFPRNDPSDFQPYRDLYPDCFPASGKFKTFAHCYALRSSGQTVLVDTGIGPGPFEFLGGASGRLVEDMNAKGVPPETIDVVVFTHLHADHVGWNLNPDNVPTFAKARYLIPQKDWEFFTAENAVAQNPQVPASVLPLKDLDVLELFSGEKSITDEITTLPTPGHTPGHVSLVVSSAGEKALITGDLAHHPAQVHRTEWCSAFDGDPDAAIASRKKVFDQLESEDTLAAICHFPDPGFGKLVQLEGKRVFQAL